MKYEFSWYYYVPSHLAALHWSNQKQRFSITHGPHARIAACKAAVSIICAAARALFVLALAVSFPACFAADYTQTFNSGPPPGWTVVSAAWAVDAGSYHSTAVG